MLWKRVKYSTVVFCHFAINVLPYMPRTSWHEKGE